MIDLHTHSTASDGTYSPKELIEHAILERVSVLALTDHDSVTGNALAFDTATKINATLEIPVIRFIAGIELDIEWKSGECHLLGLGLKENHPDLVRLLVQLNDERRNRNREIAEKMRAGGIDIDIERVEILASGGTVGRPHFAQFLVETKVVKNRQLAFDRYLARDRPYYIERKSISLEEGIAAIRACGGLPILAHPLSLYVSWGHLPEIIGSFRDRGIAGIEAWHPGAKIVECQRLEALAHSLGICATAGSDFHGVVRPDRRIGKTAGRKDIEDRFFYEELAPLLS